MEGPPNYQPLSRDEREMFQTRLEEKDEAALDANNTEIIPTSTRSFVLCLSIMLLSLSANMLLVMENAKMRIMQDRVKTAFSKLNPIPTSVRSKDPIASVSGRLTLEA